MSRFQIQPSTLSGSLTIPPSKSHTLRAILFGLMGEGKSQIHNYLLSPDTFAMIDAISQLGAEVEIQKDHLLIEGVSRKLKSAENVIDAGNSGLVLRFIAALAAHLPTYTVITGDHSIRHNRPIQPLLDALKQMGALAEPVHPDQYAPIILRGPIRAGTARLRGEDSQPVSGLLIAACFLEKESEIWVDNPGERPWIDLTLSWLKKLNLPVQNHNYTRYQIQGGGRYS
ncbi:MAG: 3-phosphoshikimate 1-carboxyvinyltransferase, partial [Chlamydiales bacterium]|nr:3-phosphoshikimate 1-carboxyvinyltransferase [Chlamydiales bacterium]